MTKTLITGINGFVGSHLAELCLKENEEVFGKDNDIEIVLDKERMRPADVPILIGDCSKLKEKIKWDNIISLRQTIKDMVQYWLNK